MSGQYKKYCDNCEREIRLTEDGYCPLCGKHADNMPPKTIDKKRKP